jgi:hypothetical protein
MALDSSSWFYACGFYYDSKTAKSINFYLYMIFFTAVYFIIFLWDHKCDIAQGIFLS